MTLSYEINKIIRKVKSEYRRKDIYKKINFMLKELQYFINTNYVVNKKHIIHRNKIDRLNEEIKNLKKENGKLRQCLKLLKVNINEKIKK